MSRTFTIDETHVKTVVKRVLFRQIKMFAIILPVVFLQEALSQTATVFSTLIALCFVVAIVGIILFMQYRRYANTISEFKITIDEAGIESKAPMAPYKKIDWENVSYVEKKNGSIKVFNKSVAAIIRWWNGTGVIFVPYEINHRDELLNELNKRVSSLV